MINGYNQIFESSLKVKLPKHELHQNNFWSWVLDLRTKYQSQSQSQITQNIVTHQSLVLNLCPNFPKYKIKQLAGPILETRRPLKSKTTSNLLNYLATTLYEKNKTSKLLKQPRNDLARERTYNCVSQQDSLITT